MSTPEIVIRPYTGDVVVEIPSVARAQVDIRGLGGPGPRGLPGSTDLVLPAAGILSGHRFLKATADNRVALPDPTSVDDLAALIGFTEGAVESGADATVKTSGVVTFSGWDWTAGAPLFCGAGGLPTATMPSGQLRQVAVALSATSIKIEIGPLIRLA